MKNIAIIMGGYSSEYKISLISGNVVYQFLDKTKYNGFRIHIFKEKWVYVTEENLEFPVDRNDFSVTVDGTKITFDAVGCFRFFKQFLFKQCSILHCFKFFVLSRYCGVY